LTALESRRPDSWRSVAEVSWRRVGARLAPVLALMLGTGVVLPSSALAHGVAERSDIPIPTWLFVWAATLVLIVSFVALASLWPRPRLEHERWRPLGRLGRLLGSRAVDITCGAIGVFLLLLTVVSGLLGEQIPSSNFAPTFVYVIFFVGLVPVSVLFGDVFRAFNPWRAISRAVEWVAARTSGEALPPPRAYPDRLGRWPAVAGLLVFAWLELVFLDGDLPRTLAIATCAYSAVTFVGIAVYGVDPWIDRAEAFSVYFNLFSRLSPFERRGREVGVRRPLSGLAQVEPLPGTVMLIATMVGTVSFDGASEGALWIGLSQTLTRALESLGLSETLAYTLVATLGVLLCVLIILLLYEAAVRGARSVGGGYTARRLASAFAHSLVPIALVYVAAHYLTLLVLQGQAMGALISDPLGDGSNLFGTAGADIDYSLLGANLVWYLQVSFVVIGHVTALALAHDRALVLYRTPELAVRSQYWMLGVMVAFTSLALWLLSQANA
jgi:hypothetical protein